MIVSVMIFKNGRGVVVGYSNGTHKDYSRSKMPKTALAFILEESTIAHENEVSILYNKKAERM